jgi:hypothetical protein
MPKKPEPPVIDGYLTKLKRKQSLFGSWATRYFHVNPDLERIEYFKLKQQASDSTYSTGYICLWDITAIRNFDGTSFQIEAGKNVMFLKADSAAERACWVQGLESYLEERREYERCVSREKGYFRRPSKGGMMGNIKD